MKFSGFNRLPFFQRVSVGTTYGAGVGTCIGGMNLGKRIVIASNDKNESSRRAEELKIFQAQDDLVRLVVFGTVFGAFAGGFPHTALGVVASEIGRVSAKIYLQSSASTPPRMR